MKQGDTHFKDVFWNNDKILKNIVLTGDFNNNLLDLETNKNVQDFLSVIFDYNVIPLTLTNKPTQITRHSANAIDDNVTNSVTDHNDFNSAIIKSDLTYHFLFVFAIKINESKQRPVVKSTYKRAYCENNISKFKNILYNRNWGDIKEIEDPNKAYKYFHNIFIDIYETRPCQNQKLKLNSRAIRALGLLRVL